MSEKYYEPSGLFKTKVYCSSSEYFEYNLCGLPISEAIKIIEIYKNNTECHLSEDYVSGFNDGYKRCQEDVKQALDNMTTNYLK